MNDDKTITPQFQDDALQSAWTHLCYTCDAVQDSEATEPELIRAVRELDAAVTRALARVERPAATERPAVMDDGTQDLLRAVQSACFEASRSPDAPNLLAFSRALLRLRWFLEGDEC